MRLWDPRQPGSAGLSRVMSLLDVPNRSRGINDGDADTYFARVVANGGTISAGTQAAVSTLVASLRNAGVWYKIQRCNLICGNQLAAALVPLVVGIGAQTDTNTNFVGGDYTEATGLTGNGSTKYLSTTIIPGATVGALSVYTRGSIGASNAVLLGCSNAGATQIYAVRKGGSTASRAYYGGTANATITETMVAGHYITNRPSSTMLELYRNGLAIATATTSTTGAGAGFPAYLFCNNAAGTAATFITAACPIAGYAILGSLSAAEALAFYTAIQAFQTSLSRQV